MLISSLLSQSISSASLIPVFPIYSLVQDPRGPASFYTHARNNVTPAEEGIDREVHREKSLTPDPSPEVSLDAFIVENLEIYRRTIDTLRRKKVPQRMLNPERFLRKRGYLLSLEARKRSCSSMSRRVKILQVKREPR